GAALRGPFQLGVGQLGAEENLGAGGAAQSHVAYADVGWVGTTFVADANTWLQGLVSESGFSLSVLDGAGLPSVRVAKGAAQNPPVAPASVQAWLVRGWSDVQQASLPVAEL